MLGVKSQNRVLHEKIRMTEEGMYELLPAHAGNKKQPKFRDVPGLIQFYVSSREDMPYTLSLTNPIYDNHQLVQARSGREQAVEVTADPSAPYVPLKDAEAAVVTQLAGDELYTNAAEAKSALGERRMSARGHGPDRMTVPGTVVEASADGPGYLSVAASSQDMA